MKKNPYEQVKEFHENFDPSPNQTPQSMDATQALYRSMFKIEEIIEFLYAAADGNTLLFTEFTEKIKESIDSTVDKVRKIRANSEGILVGEVDALIDLLYFTYGTFVLMGVDPMPIFEIVHQANMGKLFPDGKPHYHPETHKVLKPDNWEKQYAPEIKIHNEIKRQIQKIN